MTARVVELATLVCACLLGPVLFVREARADAGCVAPDGSVSQTRPAKPNGVVEIELLDGSLRIVAWNRAEVSVTGRVEGGDLDISPSVDRTRIRLVPMQGHREADLEVHVPRASRVEAKAVTADVEVEGVVGPVRLEAVSGDVKVVGTPSEVTARTASGSITLEVGAPSVAARSVSGDVRVSGARGRATIESVSGECALSGGDFTEIDMRSVSGDLEFTGGMTGQGSFEFRSHSGKIDLRLPKTTNADFELRTYSGNLESSLGGSRSASLALDFRNGNGSAKVRGRTFSGDIEIEAKK